MERNDRRRRAASEAADWFARLQSRTMERGERELFVEWLRESHVHVAEMLRIAQINGALEQFKRWTRIATGPKTGADSVVPLPTLPSEPDGRRHSFRVFAVAATVVAIIGAAIVLPKTFGRVIETERGERREVLLSDGSLLQVDSETRLRVKFSNATRRVFLTRGRAVFHVAKNSNRPFLVQANETTVRAVGTAFGVEQERRGVVVTVSEGKVAVLTAAKAPEALLTANQQVTVSSHGLTESVRAVDSRRALSWAEGRLIFQNDELGAAIEQFNRYNHVQLKVTDRVLAGKPVSGVFNAADPEAFIAFLQSVAAVEVVRDDAGGIAIGSVQRH